MNCVSVCYLVTQLKNIQNLTKLNSLDKRFTVRGLVIRQDKLGGLNLFSHH